MKNSVVFVITVLYNLILSHQLQKDIYDWEEKLAKKTSY